MNQISQPVRRLLALALLVAVPLLAYDAAILPLWTRYATARRTEARLTTLLTREGAVRARLARLRQLAGRPDRTAGAAALLAGENAAIVAARLQNALKRLADELHGEVASTQILPPADRDGLRRVGIRTQLTISVPGLQRMIYTLESQTPFLFVDDVRIRPAAPDLGTGGARAGRVVVILDVYGYIRLVRRAHAT